MKRIFSRLLFYGLTWVLFVFPAVKQEDYQRLLTTFLAAVTKDYDQAINETLNDLRDALVRNDIDTFISLIKQFYTHIPYTIAIEKEKYYQTIFYVILRLIQLEPEVERATNIGRIDMVVELQDTVYIFEFKLNGSAKAALEQIYKMKYYQPYVPYYKKIMLIGVNFSSKQRNVADYLFEEYNRTSDMNKFDFTRKEYCL